MVDLFVCSPLARVTDDAWNIAMGVARIKVDLWRAFGLGWCFRLIFTPFATIVLGWKASLHLLPFLARCFLVTERRPCFSPLVRACIQARKECPLVHG